MSASFFRVALTGGIACGKTTVTNLFTQYGVPVIDADTVSRDLTAAGQPGLAQLIAYLGKDYLQANGELDRPALRAKLFSDPRLRQQVNVLLHPLILADMQRRAAHHHTATYIMFAVPLLVESGLLETGALQVDRILVVDCSAQQQLDRLLERDKETPARARQILASQANREMRLAKADDVLANSSTPAVLKTQVKKLHEKYQWLAKQQHFKHNKGP